MGITGHVVAITGIAVCGAGLYLRWAAGPVLLAYEVGKRIGRRCCPRAQPPAASARHVCLFATAAALAMLACGTVTAAPVYAHAIPRVHRRDFMIGEGPGLMCVPGDIDHDCD